MSVKVDPQSMPHWRKFYSDVRGMPVVRHYDFHWFDVREFGSEHRSGWIKARAKRLEAER